MSWLSRYRELRRRGILGMNRRNTTYILDLNPRRLYPLVDSKSRMRDLCLAIGVPTPALYGVIATHSALRQLPRLLADRTDFVIKPDRGAAGRGILVIVGRDGEALIRHNGQRLGLGDIREHVLGILSGLFSLGGHADAALLQQRVQPHPAFERISYRGIADVRLVVHRNVPAMAMLRLPTLLSNGCANLHQGGLGAGVELETGVVTRAVLRNQVTDRHPDTGAKVVGFRVPYWPEILDMACRVARAVGMGYLGVDVVVDRKQGPLLLEGNARPGLAIQVANGRGLLPRLEEIERELGEPVAESQHV